VVTLDELYGYVYDRVREVNAHQTPSKDVEMEGELKLANNRKGRLKITKVPSPPYLSLITAVLALVLAALARHDLGSHHDLYSPRAAGGTRTLTSIAMGLAVPALVLGALASLVHLIGADHW
jgi:hypothetical protein